MFSRYLAAFLTLLIEIKPKSIIYRINTKLLPVVSEKNGENEDGSCHSEGCKQEGNYGPGAIP